MNILIAEKEEASKEMLSNLFSQHAKCKFVSDGLEAVEDIKASINKGNFYDLIFIDYDLSRMNGIQVLKSLRKCEQGTNIFGKTKVILALDSLDVTELMRFFSTTHEKFIIKPLDENQVLRVVKELQLPFNLENNSY